MQTNLLGQSVGEEIISWKAKAYPSIKVMQGDSCRLEKLEPTIHGKDLYQAFCDINDESNWTYLPYGPFFSYVSFHQWLIDSVAQEGLVFYTIIDQLTNQAVGLASYLRINPMAGVLEIGHIHFSTKIQKTRCATQAMFLMMEYVFEVLEYRRYEWKCDSLNTPSRKAAERLGFSYEGTFRQAAVYKGRNRDTAWFAVIDNDWPKLKLAFKDWLHIDNFDDEGKQKTKLARVC